MISNRKFPAVPQKDGYHLSRPHACRYQAAGCVLNEFAVFGVSNVSWWIGGRIHQSGLSRELLAGIEDRLMKKEPGRVGIESPRWLHGRHFSSHSTGRISGWPASFSGAISL